MDSAILLLTWCLAGQLPTAPEARPAELRLAQAPSRPATDRSSATGTGASRNASGVTAGVLLGDALAPQQHAQLSGRWLSLSDALGSAGDRAAQRSLVEAYWKLTAALARRHYRQADERFFAELASRYAAPAGGGTGRARTLPPPPLSPADRAALDAAMALARAMLRDSDLELVEAQHALSQAMTAPLPEPLLPTDRPHCGVYYTRYELIYANDPAPARATLLHYTLPGVLQAIDARAKAIVAVADAAAAAEEAVFASTEDLAFLVSLRERLTRERLALVDEVERYNRQIAEYVALVAVPGTLGPDYVALHIRPQTVSSGRTISETGWPSPGTEPGPDEASPWPEGSAVVPAQFNQPPAGAAPQSMIRRRRAPDASSAPGAGLGQTAPGVPPLSPLAAPGGSSGGAATLPMSLADLEQIDPNLRTQQLAGRLSGSAAQPPTRSTALSLADCLKSAWTGNRPAAVTAYWDCARELAQYQSLVRQVARLKQLDSLLRAPGQPQQPAESMLYQRAEELSASADVSSQAVDVLMAQQELAVELDQARRATAGSPSAPGAQYWTTTPLHGGRYWLALESQPAWIAQAPAVARQARRIPSLHEVLVDQTVALLALDRELAGLWSDPPTDTRRLRLVLEAIQSEQNTTQRFLADLARYNQAMADYAFRVLPPQSNWEELAAALALPRTNEPAGRR